MLKSSASTALGAGILAAGGTEMVCRRAHGSPIGARAASLPSPMWDYQRGPLCEQGLRCIAYDRRGHGRSSVARSGDCDNLAGDLAAVLSALELREVTLVGHSFGSGEIVCYFTGHGANRIAKIALIAPAADALRHENRG
jgi:non-heme chloroperoxidase